MLTMPVLSYKLQYFVVFWLVDMAISTNQKSIVYRNENTGPGVEVTSDWTLLV